MNVFKMSMNMCMAMGLLLTVVACSTVAPQGSNEAVSLFDRLGGKPAITAVVEEFVGNVAKDSRINGRFANTDIPQLKVHLVDQVCSATGGPCTYTGRDMKTTHAGMQISDADFSAMVEDLVSSLKKFKVPEAEQAELLALLGTMYSDIVEIP